VHFVGLYYTTV